MVNSFNCPTNGSSSNQEPATAGPSGLSMASMANFNGEGGDGNSVSQQMHQPMSIVDDQKTVKLEVLEDFFGVSGWDDDVSGHLATGGPLLAASPPMPNTPSPPIEHFLPTLTPRPPPPLHQAPGATSQGGGNSSSSLLMANGNRPMKMEDDFSDPDVFASLSPLPTISLATSPLSSIKTSTSAGLHVIIPPSPAAATAASAAATADTTTSVNVASSPLSSVITVNSSIAAAVAAAAAAGLGGPGAGSCNDSHHSDSPSPPLAGGPLLSPSTPTSNKKTVFTAKGKGTYHSRFRYH